MRARSIAFLLLLDDFLSVNVTGNWMEISGKFESPVSTLSVAVVLRDFGFVVSSMISAGAVTRISFTSAVESLPSNVAFRGS